MTLDLDAAVEVFAASKDGTVGLEEEFAVLEPGSLDLVGGFERLRDAAAAEDEALAASISGELISSEIEIRSGRGEDLADALARQRDMRRRLFALAARHGFALGATGTHPWADYREQRFIDTEHYRRVANSLQWVAQRNTTFAVHTHVGIRDLDRAVRVCDRLRPVLPTLLALSTSSPWLDGRDAGLHSARTQIFTKSFPRCGVPDPFGGWDAFRAYLELLIGTGSIVEYTQVWWSIRPHLSFGTVEVRMCDAQPTAREADALYGLQVACVLQAARDIDDGVPYSDIPGRLIEENVWRAIRFGMDGDLIDLAAGAEQPARAAVDELMAWTAPVRAEYGIEVDLPELNAAQRLRRALDAGASLAEAYAEAVRATRETYAPGVVTAR